MYFNYVTIIKTPSSESLGTWNLGVNHILNNSDAVLSVVHGKPLQHQAAETGSSSASTWVIQLIQIRVCGLRFRGNIGGRERKQKLLTVALVTELYRGYGGENGNYY